MSIADWLFKFVYVCVHVCVGSCQCKCVCACGCAQGFICVYVCVFVYVCAGVCLCEFFLEKSPQLLLYITLTHKYYFRSISIGIMSLPLTDRLDMFYQRDIYFLPSFTLSFIYQPPPINQITAQPWDRSLHSLDSLLSGCFYGFLLMISLGNLGREQFVAWFLYHHPYLYPIQTYKPLPEP